MERKNILLMLVVGIVILSAPAANAWGAGGPYWDDNPLVLSAGDSREVALLLQNMVGNEDVKLKATLTAGSDIAQIKNSKTDYYIPFGTRNIPVYLQIKIPEGAVIDDKYQVTVKFEQVAVDEEGGMIQITSAISKGFPVIIAEKSIPEPAQDRKPATPLELNFGGIALALIVLVAIAFVAYRFMPKPKNPRRRLR